MNMNYNFHKQEMESCSSQVQAVFKETSGKERKYTVRGLTNKTTCRKLASHNNPAPETKYQSFTCT